MGSSFVSHLFLIVLLGVVFGYLHCTDPNTETFFLSDRAERLVFAFAFQYLLDVCLEIVLFIFLVSSKFDCLNICILTRMSME